MLHGEYCSFAVAISHGEAYEDRARDLTTVILSARAGIAPDPSSDSGPLVIAQDGSVTLKR